MELPPQSKGVEPVFKSQGQVNTLTSLTSTNLDQCFFGKPKCLRLCGIKDGIIDHTDCMVDTHISAPRNYHHRKSRLVIQKVLYSRCGLSLHLRPHTNAPWKIEPPTNSNGWTVLLHVVLKLITSLLQRQMFIIVGN